MLRGIGGPDCSRSVHEIYDELCDLWPLVLLQKMARIFDYQVRLSKGSLDAPLEDLFAVPSHGILIREYR